MGCNGHEESVLNMAACSLNTIKMIILILQLGVVIFCYFRTHPLRLSHSYDTVIGFVFKFYSTCAL